MKSTSKDLFISYRREDNFGTAREIAKGLEKIGYSVFFDTADIIPGKEFPKEIETAIDNALDVILVVSQSYFGYDQKKKIRIIDRQDWCHRELAKAIRTNKHIVPIVLDAAFFRLPAEINADDTDPSVKEINSVFSINYVEYSRSEETDIFISRLQEALTEQSRNNSKRNSYREALLQIEKNSDASSINVGLKKLALSMCEDDILRYLYPILNEDEPVSLQFMAYYAIFTFYRRMEYQAKIMELVEHYGDRFADLELPFDHIVKSQYYLYRFNKSPEDRSNLDASIFHAERANKLLTTNAGVMITYSELIAIACDVDRERYQSCVPKAMSFIKQAMELNPQYPKHYYILGLLESAVGYYSDGIKSIHTAIDLEDSEGKDAFLRIVKYYDAIQNIKLKQLREEMLSIIHGKLFEHEQNN